jgi:hypothetical protein
VKVCVVNCRKPSAARPSRQVRKIAYGQAGPESQTSTTPKCQGNKADHPAPILAQRQDQPQRVLHATRGQCKHQPLDSKYQSDREGPESSWRAGAAPVSAAGSVRRLDRHAVA